MQQLKLKRPSLRTLIRIGTGGLVITGIGYLHTYLFQRRIRRTKTYKRVLEILHNHEETINHLGKPLKEGYIKFQNKQDNIRNFSVPLKGSNTEGILNCKFLITQPELQPEISKLEIIFSNLPDKSFILYEN